MRYLLVLMMLTVSACMPYVADTTTLREWYQVAVQQQNLGYWHEARQAFANVVYELPDSDEPLTFKAIAHYEYGRSLGATCFFDKAEQELLIAYGIDQQTGEPLYLSLVELARLNLDQGKYEQAVSYFERALLELDKASFSIDSPIAYADGLDEYSHALDSIGRKQEAVIHKARAAALREANPQGVSITDRTPYGAYCE